MRSTFYLLIIAFTLLNTLDCSAEIIDTLIYKDDYNTEAQFITPTETTRRSIISNKKHGTIWSRIGWPSNKNDEWKNKIKTCIDIASETWENYLCGDSISIEIIFSDEMEHDVETEVYFHERNNKTYPQALYRKLFSTTTTSIDGKITINDAFEWGLGIQNDGSKNLILAVMRAITNIMGFGSSITQYTTRRGTVLTTMSTDYSPFDYLIVAADGTYMTEITPTASSVNNPTLKDYVEGKNGSLFIEGSNTNYKLYNPSKFDPYTSLRFFDEYPSIMSYPNQNNMDLTIDDMTIEILKKIGWNINESQTLTIIGEDIDSTGTTSAYQQHRFYIDKNPQLTDYFWKLELPLKNGDTEVAYSSTYSDFTIPALSNTDRYKHTKDGQIKGHITMEGNNNGTILTADYYVTFELKPQILKAAILNCRKSDNGSDFYDIDIAINYEGSYYAYATVEYGYISTFDVFTSYCPYYSILHLSNIDFWDNVLVTIEIGNSYGYDYYKYSWNNIQDVLKDLKQRPNVDIRDKGALNINLSLKNGVIIKNLGSMESAKTTCEKGVLNIIRSTENNGNINYQKSIK